MRKKNCTAAVLAVSLLLGNVWTAQAEESAEEQQIVIYHTNDSHGYLSGDGESVVGIDQIAGLKKADPDSILVDAGDATQGLPLASLTRGADVIELMNLAGYDLMTAGNHEFDFGTEQLLSNAALADFPVLAANIWQNGKPLLGGVREGESGCHTVIERNGWKIGFFGLTTVQTETATNPEGIRGLEFRDEVETAKKEIDELEAEGADIIVAVCHMGNGDAPCTSTELAEALTGEYQDKVDVLIDGHSHTVESGEEVNGIPIVQTGCNMAAVGKLTLTVNGEEVEVEEELLTPADLAAAGVQADPEVTAKLSEIEASQAELLNEEIGQTDTTLWAGWIGNIAPTRLEETNYGDFAADALRSAGEAFQSGRGDSLPVIAVENGGGIREAVYNGTVTEGSLIAAFPFSNTLYMKVVTPQILYQVMEVSAGCLDGQDPETGMLLQQSISGGFLQISGFRTVFNPDAEPGSRVVSVTLEGQSEPLDRNDGETQILMVSNNYIMSGGNDYTMLGELPKYGEAGGELEAVKSYLEQCLSAGTMEQYAGTEGRILMRGNGYDGGSYTVSVAVADEEGNPLAAQALSYRVDGGKRVNGVTDAEGYLRIELEEGAHGIRLADSQQEVYVSNYSGLGLREDALRAFPSLTFLADGSCDPVQEPAQEPTQEPAQKPSEPSQEPTQKPSEPDETPSAVQTPSVTGTSGRPSGDPVTVKPADTGNKGSGSAAGLLASALALLLLLAAARKRQRG